MKGRRNWKNGKGCKKWKEEGKGGMGKQVKRKGNRCKLKLDRK